jgi:hypothetical protein
MTITIEYHTTGRGYRQKSDALILCNLCVVWASNKLKVIKPDAQESQHQNHTDLYKPKSDAKILRRVFEFHNSKQPTANGQQPTAKGR